MDVLLLVFMVVAVVWMGVSIGMWVLDRVDPPHRERDWSEGWNNTSMSWHGHVVIESDRRYTYSYGPED